MGRRTGGRIVAIVTARVAELRAGGSTAGEPAVKYDGAGVRGCDVKGENYAWHPQWRNSKILRNVYNTGLLCRIES